MAAEAPQRNRFLLTNPEKEDLNQYWYSIPTIQAMVDEVVEHAEGQPVAFLSTPSIYFSLPREARAACKVFDLDAKWQKDPGFVMYDFSKPEDIPAELHGSFAMAVVDPPFITHEVWAKYAEACRILLRPGGKLLLSTIQENADFLRQEMGVVPTAFWPSIPHLVYQYCFYVNYESGRLSEPNPEIPV